MEEKTGENRTGRDEEVTGSEIFETPKLTLTDEIEKSLRFHLGTKLNTIRKLGDEIFCEVVKENLASVLAEVKNKPELALESLNCIKLCGQDRSPFLIVSLYSVLNNFWLLIKVKLPYPVSRDEYNKTLDLIGSYFVQAKFYKDETVPVSYCQDVKIFSQALDGLDGFDVYASCFDDVLEDVYIDTSLSSIGASRFYADKEISRLLPYMGRLDYRAAIFPELCFCIGIEGLLQLKVPKRAQYIRMLVCELFRISNHIYYITVISEIMGYDVIVSLSMIERERILKIIEHITGSRVLPNFIRVGGVREDISDEIIGEIKTEIGVLYRGLRKIESMFLGNIVVVERLRNVGVVNRALALEYGISGPNLRACGIRYDLRKSRNFLSYEDFSFVVPLEKRGDCLGRTELRFREIYQSIKIINQIIEQMPLGVVRKIINLSHIKLPFSNMVSSVECPHGVFRIYAEFKDTKVLNLVFMGPSFNSVLLGERILKEGKLEDFNLILASLDISPGEILS